MNDIEDKIKQYFKDSNDIPNLSETQIQNIHNKISTNKKKNSTKPILMKLLISICCILIITPCFIIPILQFNKQNKTPSPPPAYYTDNTANQVVLDYEFTTNYIASNYPQYNFIFTDCQTSITLGYYDNNILLALDITLIKNDPPFSDLKFVLVTQDNFNYSDHNNFINTSNIETFENYILYKTENTSFYDTTIYGLFDYENYNLYITVNRSDNEFFEKFL